MLIKNSFLALAFTIVTTQSFSNQDCTPCDKKEQIDSPKKIETTFAMIKPEAVQGRHVGDIISMIESKGFQISRMKMIKMTKEEAHTLYAEHKGKPFFNDLVAYITSEPIVVLALKKENAVQEWRSLIGTTDPKNSPEGTIRKKFATDKQKNAVHGSDSVESATREVGIFFPGLVKKEYKKKK
jgi:nucleoside-diphosphate kinase